MIKHGSMQFCHMLCVLLRSKFLKILEIVQQQLKLRDFAEELWVSLKEGNTRVCWNYIGEYMDVDSWYLNWTWVWVWLKLWQSSVYRKKWDSLTEHSQEKLLQVSVEALWYESNNLKLEPQWWLNMTILILKQSLREVFSNKQMWCAYMRGTFQCEKDA